MKQKILSIIALLLMTVTGAWAQTDLTIPLTLKATSNGTIVVSNHKEGMQYSKNGGAKMAITEETEETIYVEKNDVVAFYGNSTLITNYNGTQFAGTANRIVYGNIMSLVDETNYATDTELTGDNAFGGLFMYNTTLTDASGLLLPAIKLVDNCYVRMFYGCSNLTKAPTLPAFKLTDRCYHEMFKGCTMLNSVTCLAMDISASDCTTDWLDGVAAKGTFNKAVGMTWTSGASGIPSGWTVKENLGTPLTLEAKTNGNIQVINPKVGMTYSMNGGAKKAIPDGDPTYNIAVYEDDIVQFYGYVTTYDGTCIVVNDAECYLFGNIMSLVNEYDFDTAKELKADKTFRNLFSGSTKLLSHDSRKLVLPATTLKSNCYELMFNGCTNLTTAPELPATTLAEFCYDNMFAGCTSLTTAPELSSTTLATGCYYGMFTGCTSLAQAPELPATKLAASCYSDMFNGCTSLTKAPVLPATKLAAYCYWDMFNGCTNLHSVTCLATDITATNATRNWLKGVAATGTFVKAKNMTAWETGASGIPSGWTVKNNLGTPLTLEAKTAGEIRVKNPKEGMTYSKNGGEKTAIPNGNLTYSINVAVGDIVEFYGNCNSYDGTIIFVKGDGCAECYIYGNIMSLLDENDYDTAIELKEEKTFYCLFAESSKLLSHDSKKLVLPATTLTQKCYEQMFSDCTSLTTAPDLPATTLANHCYENMFQGCTSLTTAPVLPAEKLATACYKGMFVSCSHLNSVTCLATDITSATAPTYQWLQGVAATGTFVKAKDMTAWTIGVDGIPSGWTTGGAPTKTLDESEDNSTWISTNAGKAYTITLTRTLGATGWNTFSVPFNIPADMWASYNISAVKKLKSSALEGESMTLTFEDESTKIEAGKPYMVKVSSEVENPTFDDVVISSTTTSTQTQYADFVPVIKPTAIKEEDKSVLFLTGGTKLTWPNLNGTIKGFRAYFQLNEAMSARSVVMDFDDSETTGISEKIKAKSDKFAATEGWYTIDGRRLQGEPTQKGLYIVNGRKVIVK